MGGSTRDAAYTPRLATLSLPALVQRNVEQIGVPGTVTALWHIMNTATSPSDEIMGCPPLDMGPSVSSHSSAVKVGELAQLHVLDAQCRQLGPPQSTLVSSPFFTPSSQAGARQSPERQLPL